MLEGLHDNIGVKFFFAILLLQPGQLNTKEPYLLRLTSRTLTTHMAVSKA